MQISHVSPQAPISDTQNARPATTAKSNSPSATDSVHLSAAAKAQVAGRDADGDNDGH